MKISADIHNDQLTIYNIPILEFSGVGNSVTYHLVHRAVIHKKHNTIISLNVKDGFCDSVKEKQNLIDRTLLGSRNINEAVDGLNNIL